MRLIIIFLSYISFLFANSDNKLYLAVCSNLGGTIEELVSDFQKINPDIKIETTIASSGHLTAQIQNGARYQIFLSADFSHPQKLFDSGLATTRPVLYTRGALALFSKEQRDLSAGVNLLLDKNIRYVALANPRTAPYGIAGLEALKSSKVFYKIKSKLVYANSISQTLAYATVAADAGVVALSSMYNNTQKFKHGLNWIELNSSLYTYTKQGMCITKMGKNDKRAKIFSKYMLTEGAQEILKKHGYKQI